LFQFHFLKANKESSYVIESNKLRLPWISRDKSIAKSEAFTAANVNRTFSDYQPCHQMMETEMILETSVIFNQLTWLIAQEDFMKALLLKTGRL
jgi:pantothenate kinase-related protein Tda10